MTIGVNNRNDADGNNTADTFPYGFKIFAATDLEVKVRDAAGIETTLTYLTHYTVTNVGVKAGGNVVLVNGAFAWLDGDGDLLTGYHLTIRRVRPLTQATDIRNQGGFFADQHEDTFDHLMMVDQQQQDEIDRTLKLPVTEDGSPSLTTLPGLATRKGQVIGFDAITGNPTLYPTSAATSVLASIVQYIASGVGAVMRSLQDKARDTHHVKEYGAVCDLTSDDTTELSDAVTASVSKSLIWTGTPRITSGLTISNGNHQFDGSAGITSATRPGSYIVKDDTLNGVAVTIGALARFEGGGVVAEEGNGGANIKFLAPSASWRKGYSENAGTDGWVIDGEAANCNNFLLDHCISYGNTSDGFYVTGTNGNAGIFLGCQSINNGGDGFFSEKTGATTNPAWNLYLGCLGENNTGYGIHLKGGTDNAIIGGDYEGNTAGDIYIESTESYTTLLAQNRGSVITDNGFYTRRLDRYRYKKGSFHPAFMSGSGATNTATAYSVSGTTATITSAAHGFDAGDTIYHVNFSNANLNGAFAISNVTANTYDITIRSDSSLTVPTSGSGLTVTIQKCGEASIAVGRYIVRDGTCKVWGHIVTSDVTNLSGVVQLVMPFATETIADLYTDIAISYHAGITYQNELRCILTQGGGALANIWEDVNGTPGTPSQLGAAGLAAVTTIVFHGEYLIDFDH